DPAEFFALLDGQPERSCYPILVCLREELAKMFRLLVADPRRQTILSRFHELLHDALDPGTGFSLAEDHLGKAATLPALQIHVRETEVDHWSVRGPGQGFIDAQSAGMYLFEKFTEIVGLHRFRPVSLQHATQCYSS